MHKRGSHLKGPSFGAKTRSVSPMPTWLPQGWWVLDSHQYLFHQLFSSQVLGLGSSIKGQARGLLASGQFLPRPFSSCSAEPRHGAGGEGIPFH